MALRRILPSLLVVASATVALPLDSARAQMTSPDCTRGELETLDVARTGETIEDGVGYGGVRIGDSESALVTAWGPTSCNPARQGALRVYVALRDADQAVEMVLVHTLAGRVAAILVGTPPHAGLKRLIRRSTREGVSVGMTLADVERRYGPAEARTGPILLYHSRGIGFFQQSGYVLEIVIFAPGTAPDLDGIFY